MLMAENLQIIIKIISIFLIQQNREEVYYEALPPQLVSLRLHAAVVHVLSAKSESRNISG
jgi:hypothetical protein